MLGMLYCVNINRKFKTTTYNAVKYNIFNELVFIVLASRMGRVSVFGIVGCTKFSINSSFGNVYIAIAVL